MAMNRADAPEILQEQVTSMLLQPLEAQSVVLAAGPKIFDSASPLRIPTLVGSGTPAVVGESELIPDDYSAEFGEIRLMPESRKSIKSITRYSNELARQAIVGLDAVLKARMVNDISQMLDEQMLAGDGANDTITGLLNQPGTQSAEYDPAEPDAFLDAQALLSAAEVTANRLLVNGTDFITLRKAKDGNGRYLLESDLTRDATYRLFGTPVTVSNKIPQGTAILADFSTVAVVRDTAPSVKILDQTYAAHDQQAIRVTTRWDLGLLRPEAVVIMGGDGGE